MSAESPAEPWWKKAPQAPPPRWASPAAVRRQRLLQTTLPSRLTARAAGDAEEPTHQAADTAEPVDAPARDGREDARGAVSEPARV
jgi:hypothetical protein